MTSAVRDPELLSSCPSCGMTIPRAAECCYCSGATSPARRVSEFKLALAAVPALVIALVLLSLAWDRETPIAQSADLTRADAYDHVRVTGVVTEVEFDDTDYDASDVFSFWVKDKSVPDGDPGLKIKVEGLVLHKIMDGGLLPEIGDTVDVEGAFQAGRNFRQIAVKTAGMVRIVERGKPTPGAVETD